MRFVRLVPSLLAAAVLAGCAGSHGSSTLPSVPTQAAKRTGAATFVIKVPQSTSSSASASRATARVRPQYVSPATQSMTIDISGPTDVDETADLTIGSSGCTSSLASTICTLTISGLQPCTTPPTNCYTATLTTYDQTGGTGNVLSAAQAVAFTVAAGQTNQISLTLSGVPATTLIIPAGSFIEANGSGGYNLLGQCACSFIAESLDVDGNIITGPGAPTFTISQTGGSLGVTVPSATTASAPNSFTITPPATYSSATATISVTPTFSGQATNGCTQTGANCGAVTVSVGMAVLLYVTSYSDVGGAVTAYNDEGVQQTLTGGFPNVSGSYDVAYDPSSGYLYVTDVNNAVTAYNDEGAQQTLSGSFANVDGPLCIAYDPSNGYLYVTNLDPFFNSTVNAYNGEGVQQTLTGTFPNVSFPYGIAYDPSNGYLYVTEQNAETNVTTVNAYNDEGVEQTLSPSFPSLTADGIAYDPSNGYLYVTTNPVTAYDQNGNEQTLSGSFPNLDGPFGIAYDPSNGYLYVTNFSNNTVTAYDQNGNQQTLTGSFPNLSDPAGVTIVP